MQELWGKFCEKLGTFLERARSPKGSVSVNYKVNYWLITRFGRAGRRCGYGMVPEVYGVARLQRLGLTIRACPQGGYNLPREMFLGMCVNQIEAHNTPKNRRGGCVGY